MSEQKVPDTSHMQLQREQMESLPTVQYWLTHMGRLSQDELAGGHVLTLTHMKATSSLLGLTGMVVQ